MNNEVIEILEKTGALMINGHFVGTSGRHIDTYVNKDALYTHPEQTSKVCKLMAKATEDSRPWTLIGSGKSRPREAGLPIAAATRMNSTPRRPAKLDAKAAGRDTSMTTAKLLKIQHIPFPM